MRIHLPPGLNKECLHCKKAYRVPSFRLEKSKYCSRACKKAYNKAPSTIHNCPVCKKDFERINWIQKNANTEYCSTDCYYKRSPPIETICLCGNKFDAYPSRVSYYGQIYYNQECYSKYGFFGRLTDDIPETTNYSKFVAKLRSTAKYLHWHKACLDRDNNQCTNCPNKIGLTVHHLFSIYDFVKKNTLNKELIETDPLFFDTINGKTLCRKCHLNVHRKIKDE